MGLTKPKLHKNFAFFTLTTEKMRDIVLKDGLAYKNEKLQVSITRNHVAENPSVLQTNANLIANNFPQRETQPSS